MMNSVTNNSTLIAIVFINVIVFGGLIAYILYQGRKINKLEEAAKPRYGFLGKPIFSVLALALMIGSFGITYLVSKGTPDYSVGEEIKVELEIKANVIERNDDQVTVEFQVIPTVDGVLWGGSERNKFDAFWSIKGTDGTLSEIESGLTLNNTGGFERTLTAGSYEVRVDVLHRGFTWTLKRTVQF